MLDMIFIARKAGGMEQVIWMKDSKCKFFEENKDRQQEQLSYREIGTSLHVDVDIFPSLPAGLYLGKSWLFPCKQALF